MYLRGSKLSLTRRRRRSNPLLVITLLALVGVFVYIDRVVVPQTPPLFVPTPTPTRSPESFVTEAEGYYSQGKLAQAMKSYEQAILVQPDDPSNYLALARLQVLTHNYQDALSNAENALLINSNNPLAHALRGWALGLKEQPNYLEAEAALNKALALDPNNPYAHAFLAEILGIQHELGEGGLDTLDRAIAESRMARDLGPSLLEVHRVRGYVHMLVSEYSEAVQEYNAAIAINENIPDLHMALGWAYEVQEMYPEAINEYTRAYSLNPVDPMPNFSISRVLARIGDFPQAVQYAEQAAQDAPENAALWGNLGSMYYKTEEYDRATDYLGLAIRGGTTEDGVVVKGIPLDPSLQTTLFYSRFGLALARNNRCSEAVQVAAALIQGVPNDEDALYNAQVMIDICKGLQEATPEGSTDETSQATATP